MMEAKVTTKRTAIAAFLTAVCLTMICLTLPVFAQQSKSQQSKTVTKGPIVIKEFKHDTGPLLREITPLLPEYGIPALHEIENKVPRRPWSNKVEKDPVLQTEENSPKLQTPNFLTEFDGISFGDNFFCNCMPPDNDGAPGTTQYVQYVNLTYQVFDKSGNTLLGPLSGNDFWSGFGGSCQNDNSGDPVVRFDAAAQRWVVSQFAINSSSPDYECVGVSTTADATGSYNRYAFPLNNFPDYPKFGVWPDAYYFTFNNFTISGSAFVGANACAADRTKMIAGAAATMQCFQQNSSQASLLPSDLDGATPPAAGTPGFFMELDPSGSANLDLFKFHVDFTTPANSTFTGPTLIPVAAFTPLCISNGGHEDCVPQPTSGSDLLEALSDRLMFRLSYRNFGDHTTLMVSHSIAAGSSGGARWYEIRNPETSPTVFQSGTFAPDASWRWMPSMAMDQNQDIAVGYSKSSATAGDYPSLVYAGRTPTDPAGTLESEVVLKQGQGSQSSGGVSRWGDYTSMTVDPTDDCTFWFSEEYLKTTGDNSGFNWSTAIGSFKFPGCNTTPNFGLGAAPNSLIIQQGASGTSTVTVTPLNGFNGSVTLSATGLPHGVTAAFGTNPTTSTSTLTLTASASAATGTATVTITGVSGSLTNTTTLSLSVNSPTQSFTLSPSPSTVILVQGGATNSSTISIVPSNGFASPVTLTTSKLPNGVTASFGTNPATTSSVLTLQASATAAKGTTSLVITGTSGTLTATTTLNLTVTAFGNFTLTAAPKKLTVVLGTSGTSTITVVPTAGFDQNVNLTVKGLTPGVTATLTPNPTTSTSTLTLTASSTANQGTSTITVTGTSGTLVHTATVTLVVVQPDFKLTASPSALTVAQGGNGTSTITINPLNTFNQSVTLIATGVPTGVTATFGTNPATSTSTLTLTVSASAKLKTSTITITGKSGYLSHTTPVKLTVTAP
jgi:hypothetical protein